MKGLFFTLLVQSLCFCSLSANGQGKPWDFSGDTKWKYKYSRAHGTKVAFPIFPQALKEMEGYLVPTKTAGGILLMFHTAAERSCLHCAGGMANILGIEPKENIEINLNKKNIFRGNLFLNEQQSRFIYYLKKAELLIEKTVQFQTINYD